ncbi:hypothetical protein [Vreelandella massiliensis]|uniref:hypothetical protein n=1 Tax=Vreelandella massiliensis TaxID=1816686 RepID=UPI00096A99D1|nr:hypothetical protein [Halomonas massiliensis]
MSDSTILKKWKHFIGVKEGVWPILRLVGHLENMSRRDVFSYLKGHIERHFPEHINEHAFVALKRYQNGWLYELCLGGDGRSRLDGILSFLESATTEDRLVLPAGHRFGELSVANSGRVVYRLLPEDEHQNYTELPPSKKASSLYPSFNNVLIAGGFSFLIGASTFALTLALVINADTMEQSLAIEDMHQKAALAQSRQYTEIPGQYIENDEVRREPGLYEYIRALTYDGLKWTTVIGCQGDRCEAPETVIHE